MKRVKRFHLIIICHSSKVLYAVARDMRDETRMLMLKMEYNGVLSSCCCWCSSFECMVEWGRNCGKSFSVFYVWNAHKKVFFRFESLEKYQVSVCTSFQWKKFSDSRNSTLFANFSLSQNDFWWKFSRLLVLFWDMSKVKKEDENQRECFLMVFSFDFHHQLSFSAKCGAFIDTNKIDWLYKDWMYMCNIMGVMETGKIKLQSYFLFNFPRSFPLFHHQPQKT